MSGQDLALALATISALSGAVAAIASWRSISLSRESRLPHLGIEVADIDGEISVTVRNNGPGAARLVGYALILGNEISGVTGWPHGFLAAGEHFVVEPAFSRTAPHLLEADEGMAFIGCRDIYGFQRIWTFEDDALVLRKFSFRRLRWVPVYLDESQILVKLYGEKARRVLPSLRRVNFVPRPDLGHPKGAPWEPNAKRDIFT